MKKTLIAVLVLVAILLLAPLALGRLAERHAVTMLDAAAEKAPWLSVVDHQWQRGWFRSRQQVTLAVVSADDAQPARFVLHNRVLHGPLLGLSGLGVARVESTLELPAELAASLRQTFGEQPAARMTTRIGFLGGGSTRLVSQGRTLTPPDGEAQVMYETARFTIDFSRGLDRYEMDGRLPRVEVRGRDGQLAVFDRLTMDGQARRVDGFRYLHDSQFQAQLRGLEVAGPATGFTLQDARYAGGMETRDGLVGMRIELGSGAVEGAQLQATGLQVTGLHYDLALERLHAPSMEAVYRSVEQAWPQLPAGDGEDAMAQDAVASQQADADFAASLAQHMGGLLSQDPALTLRRVALVTPQGEVLLEGVVRVAGMSAADFQAAGFAGMLGRLQADLTFSLPQAVAEQVPNGAMMTGFGVDAGYLVREADRLVARIQYRDGTLTVNGMTQAVPLPGMAP